jgi:hypothetical protein
MRICTTHELRNCRKKLGNIPPWDTARKNSARSGHTSKTRSLSWVSTLRLGVILFYPQ